MAHFAKINTNGNVQEVLVVDNRDIKDENQVEQESLGVQFLFALTGHSNWKQTSYNGNMRKNYAGIGYSYDSVRDAFIAPKPFTSWLLNETTCQWEAPVAYPNTGLHYVWNETLLLWVLS